MITQLDNQEWQRELVTGNAQFIEVGSTIYVVSQVRADNTFAVFKSNPTPPTPGPGASFSITAIYTFPVINGKNNSSFDPVIAYDSVGQVLYIVGTQDDVDGKDIDVILFAYNTANDTLGPPTTITTASYIRDSYDVCVLSGSGHPFVVVAVTNPSIIWQTPTVSDVTGISISSDVLTVQAFNSYSVGQGITLSALQNATFLNGQTVTVTGTGVGYFTASFTHADYTQVGYESGFATWLPGHSLIAFEFTDTLSPPAVGLDSITVLDASPFSTGNTFGAVSVYSPDGLNIEVYYEAHPKQITFADQTFSIILASRNHTSSPPTLMWSLGNILTSFTGRYADTRLTVIPSGTTRTLLQQFFSQEVHQNALIGNLLLGYYDGTVALSPPQPLGQWSFHITPGSNTTSYIQGTLSVASTTGAFVSYLAEPVYSLRGEWSPQVKRYAVNDRVRYGTTDYIVNTALTYNYLGAWVSENTYPAGAVVQSALATNPVSYAFYTTIDGVPVSVVAPNLNPTNWTATPTPDIDPRFTLAPTSWPLKTSALDVATFNLSDVPGFYNTLNFTWLRGSKTPFDDLSQWGVIGEQQGSTTSGATYVSNFNTPPIVKLVPSGAATAYRATPLFFDASGTNDGDSDTVEYTWTYSPHNSYVSLTPNLIMGNTATFTVSRGIGGAAETFVVGVVAVNYNGVIPEHPPMNITNIAISGNVLTVTTSAPVNLAHGESVFLYNIASATFLNDVQVVVSGTSGNNFSAPFTHAYYTAADTGKAIANVQYGFCTVTVPFNAVPTIDFTHDGTTHNPVTLPISAARNSVVTIHPTYGGISDNDDSVTYSWTQVSGTPILSTQILSGVTSSFLQFETNGAPVQGDTIVWSLTVSDGVNTPTYATVTVDVAPFAFVLTDTLQLSRSMWNGNISQRNSAQTWSALDVSTIYTNFNNIKRNSVLDGSDRYILISPASVTIYGGVSPNIILLRRLFTPNSSTIVDAVHTENDYTLVLDNASKLYRYSTAPLINTDNPDTTIDLTMISSMIFNKVFTTFSFGNVRIVILTGSEGCLLIQLRNTDLQLQGALELTVGAGLLYGVDNVQFVRISNVESLNTGKLLLGTIAVVSARVTSVNVTGNSVTLVANNTFSQGTVVTFADLTGATFLNGVTASVVSATPTQFVISFKHADYPTTTEGSDAIASTGGSTYETLIDLSHGQIIGTWDATKLRNQFVTTGEILFEPNDTYAGRPAAPVMNSVVNAGAASQPGYVNLGISWDADRPDLIQSYHLETSFDQVNWTVSLVNSGFIESVIIPSPIGQQYYFRVIALSVDGNSPYSNIVSINT